MKKTLSLLMGALLVAMLPMGNVKAQDKTVQVEVRTLDRAALVSATIYGDTVSGRNYFVDSTLLDTSYTGTVLPVDSMAYSLALTLSTDGTTATGSVDSALFGRSLIVLRDANGKAYVVGNITSRTQGVFQASNLFLGTTTGLDLTGASAATALSNMLVESPLINVGGYQYSNLRNATAYTTEADTIAYNGNIAAGIIDSIVGPVAVNFTGDTILGAIAVTHTSGTATIIGGKINAVMGSNDNAPLALIAIDSLGSLTPGLHATTINGGNYGVISPVSGADVTIYSGNFTNKYPTYTANRFSFGNNIGANAALYPFTIIPGYTVTWVNYDQNFNDTTVVYNEADDHIRPALPLTYDHTTTSLNWFTDAAYTSPWDFENYVLVSDTTLYAKWSVLGAGMARYYVVHNRLDANDALLYTDTIAEADSIGHRVVAHHLFYFGYTADNDSLVIDSLADNATILTFTYTRTSHTLTWNLNGGQFTDGFSETQNLKWGATIDYSHIPVLEGHTFTTWLPSSFVTMPMHSLTINAQYNERLYGLTWTGVGGTTPYTGSAITGVSATFDDDNGNTVNAILHYIDNNGDTSSQAVAVGSYRIVATSPNSNYHFNSDTVRTLVVVPDTLKVTGTTVESNKMYDGNSIAVVTNPGTLNNVHGTDQVTLNTIAQFTDAIPGTGKTIVAYYTIGGADVANYVLDTNYAIIVRNSATIMAMPTSCNNVYTSGAGTATMGGFCGDTATIVLSFPFTTGLPDQFSLTFPADAQSEGFADVNWANLTNDSIIEFIIPAAAASKDYTVQLKLRQAAYPTLESTPITLTFHVNMNKDYAVAIFGDVISIVNKGDMEQFDYYQWYRDGAIIPGATAPYYQDPTGLTGHTYFVELYSSTTGIFTHTCPQDVVDVPAESDVFNPVVSTYPNPTTDKISVNVSNTDSDIHVIRMMNVLGQVIVNTTFEGNETSIDMSDYAQGTYTVTVDGITVRVIKK